MSWQKVKLGSILTESKVISEYPDTNKRIKVRLKVLGVEKRGIENEVEGATKQFIRRGGQFIFGKQNFHKGAFGIVPDELDGYESSSDLPAFDIDKSCLPEFLFYFFKQGNYYLELSKIAYGVATQRINMKEFFELEFPLPDIEIQNQIINQFKTLENGGLEISSELTHQLNLIKQLRQAFLREAMQGKLVKSSNTKETGQQLLDKIKAEKAQLIAEKKLKKEKELPPITEDEIPFEIPEHWAWSKIDKLVSSLNKDIRTGPFGTALQKNEHKKEGIPVWGIESISKDGKFTNINKIYVSDEKAKELKSFEVKGRDLIISRSGTIGELCMLPFNVEYGLISTNLMKISVDQKVIMPEYFCHIIKGGDYITKMLQEFCSGSTRLFITQKILSKLIFPLPPLHEQEQIVAKLEELMAFCDGLKQSIKESQGYNEMLLQQVLREALQG